MLLRLSIVISLLFFLFFFFNLELFNTAFFEDIGSFVLLNPYTLIYITSPWP